MTVSNLENPILFVISSVIHFHNSSLSYNSTRSIFTSKTRTEQTLGTIESIRSKVPNSEIILIESGLKKNINKKIIGAVDKYIYTGDKYIVRLACDSSKKGLGEATSLYYGLRALSVSKHRYVFKISGRYYLNENFRLSNFNLKSDFSFKYYNNPKQVSTRLYGVNKERFYDWIKILKYSSPKLLFNKSIEELLYIKTKNMHCANVDVLGVSGFVGPNGESIDE